MQIIIYGSLVLIMMHGLFKAVITLQFKVVEIGLLGPSRITSINCRSYVYVY